MLLNHMKLLLNILAVDQKKFVEYLKTARKANGAMALNA